MMVITRVPVFLGAILWFDPRREHSSVPTAVLPAAARRTCQGWPRLRGHPLGLGLDRPEHGGRLDRSGAGGCWHLDGDADGGGPIRNAPAGSGFGGECVHRVIIVEPRCASTAPCRQKPRSTPVELDTVSRFPTSIGLTGSGNGKRAHPVSSAQTRHSINHC
jgi:hypothetical protein